MVRRIYFSLKPALIITRREVRDQFRDWRIIFPIVLLTVLFPSLMNFTAGQAVGFVQRYGANLLATRFIPFLLMIVGFFPITVSLVIALESFAGETERRSIEPLLSSPLADWQLYLGKLLASLIPPIAGSYLGITTYLIGVYRNVGWRAEPVFLIQILLLATVQALVMVSGAVVVSTQTTSVRAANLLSSFIIIPMSLLIQAESVMMFWADLSTLWWAIFGQALVAGMLVRAGIAHFNREDLLGREIDVLNVGKSFRIFKAAFLGEAHSLREWFSRELWQAVRHLFIPAITAIVLLALGIWIGAEQADKLNLPPDILNIQSLVDLDPGIITGMRAMGFFSVQGVLTVWLHNLRAVALAAALGIFSFGVIGILVLIIPLGALGFFAQSAASIGISPVRFFTAFSLPHGFLEFPALILAGAAILRIGATLVTPAHGQTISEAWLRALADFAKVMAGLIIPLFLLAAIVEVFVTPHTMLLLLGK